MLWALQGLRLQQHAERQGVPRVTLEQVSAGMSPTLLIAPIMGFEA